ncbi:IclR family transcriptional regulator domain-containing protein [Microlunatus spumicola]|uniref:IclR family transcriptional regulator domain-containing protein n=1 Tax=Microlunatus spumicola TaxID=81499 RepID=UPI001959812A
MVTEVRAEEARLDPTGDQDSRRGGAAAESGVTAPSPAAYRAGLVLELLAKRSEPLPLTALATELELAKSSVLNLLVSLEASGMVRRTPAGWVLGFKVLELSRAALTSTEVVAEFHRATSASRELRRETVVLAVLDGTDVVYVARHDGQQPVRYVNEIGTRNPAAVTALGRAMLAGLPDEELDRRLGDTAQLPMRTQRSLRTVDQLRADLREVRRRGYSIDDEQGVPGIRCFSVPVGSPGSPTAVSVSFVADRQTLELETAVVAGLTRLAARLRRAEPS